MPTFSTDYVTQYDTLVSPFESAEQPPWLQQASAEERHQLARQQATGRAARREAQQQFGKLQSLYAYNQADLGALDAATVSAHVFYQLQQRHQLDERYSTYLEVALQDRELSNAKQDAWLATLREEYTIAVIKGQLLRDEGRRLLDWIIDAYPSGSAEFKQQGPFTGIHLAECAHLVVNDTVAAPEVIVLLSGPDLPCVVYMPGHPLHPLKQYPSPASFYVSLRRELQDFAFHTYFNRFIALRQRQSLNVAALGCEVLQQGLRGHLVDQMRARLLGDAEYLIATSPEQAAALKLALPDYPEHLQAHLNEGAGAGLGAGEEDEGRAPSDWLAQRRWVARDSGGREHWMVDLGPYRLPPAEHPSVAADHQGLYRQDEATLIAINGSFYRVAQDSDQQWRIVAPGAANGFEPRLQHNGAGAWHHALEQPQRWNRLALLRRLGPISAGLDDERLLRLARVAAVSNDPLRQVYLLDKPIPIALQDTLLRARIEDESAATLLRISRGQPVPDIDLIPEVKAFYRAVAQANGEAEPLSRTRRSDDPPGTPAPAEDCVGECVPPRSDLLTIWNLRLAMAIGVHRYEAAQLPADTVVRELQRRFPLLPLSYAQRYVDENHAQVDRQLSNPYTSLPLIPAEQLQVMEHDARLTRALEGFNQRWSTHEETFILAIHLLEYLHGWVPGTPLLLRRGGRFGDPLAELGETDVDTTCIYRDEDEGWFAVSAEGVLLAQDLTELGFYRAVLYTLGESQRIALGFGINEPARLQQRLSEMALARPQRARLLLGMPVPRNWLSPPQLGVQQRRSRAGLLASAHSDSALMQRESAQTRVERLLTHTAFWRSTAVQTWLATMTRQARPIDAIVSDLEQQRQLLDSTVQTWINQSADLTARIARERVSDRLQQAWESELSRNGYSLSFTDPATAGMPPLPCPLPDVISLRVADMHNLDGLAQMLEQLPNLRRLELTNLPLAELPESLTQLQQLRWLDLSRTRLTPGSLARVGRLRNLNTLVISNQDNPDSTWTARHMERVMAGGNLRTLTMENSQARFDTGVFEVLSRGNLYALNLTQNQIALDQRSSAELAGLTELRVLDLSRNPLQHTPDLRQMIDLEELDLSHSAILEWPLGLEFLPALQVADLSYLRIAEVPAGAGLTQGLRMSSAHLDEANRQRFEQEMRTAGNRYDDDEDSSSGDASSTSSDAETAAVRTANALRDGSRLFEGMNDGDLARAEALLATTGSATAEFFALLLRIDVSYAARQPAERMRQRIQAIIRGAFNADLRRTLIEQAQQAMSCVDRDALVFSQMENTLHADQALARADDEHAMHELVALGTSHWRAARLREHVASNVRAWRHLGYSVDYSEIELYFRIALATRLNLRDQPSTQVFTSYTQWVTAQMLETAYQAVIAQQDVLLPVYLHAQAYWQRFLETAYATRIAEIDQWRASIGGYLDAAASEDDLLPEPGESDRQRLRQLLVDIGQLGVADELPTVVRLDTGAYVRAYDVLQERVEQARLEITRAIVREPQPGPSWRP